MINGSELLSINQMLESNTLSLMHRLNSVVEESTGEVVVCIPKLSYYSVKWCTMQRFFKLQKWVVDATIEGEMAYIKIVNTALDK